NVARDHVRTLAYDTVPGRTTAQPGLAVLAHVGEAKVLAIERRKPAHLAERMQAVIDHALFVGVGLAIAVAVGRPPVQVVDDDLAVFPGLVLFDAAGLEVLRD